MISCSVLHYIISPLIKAAFNSLLRLQHFPLQWAIGLIVPIHKSGELDDPNNYRGITLNSCLSKLFTVLLNNRLTELCDSMGLINYNQIGFRQGFRTSDHVFTLKTIIDQSFSKKEKLYTCFVDFKKAYDTVWRKGLFWKLLNSGFSSKLVYLIQDMYSRLQVCISLPNGISVPFQSLVGLKHGFNLSPLLFNIFINDLPNIIDKCNGDPPMLDGMKVSCLLYADDLVLLSKSKEALQNSIDALYNFTKDWFLDINKTKTKCLIFSRGRKSESNCNFRLGETTLQICNSYCYLGILFSRSGSFKEASKALNGKASGAMFSLIRNLYNHRSVSINLMLDLFDKMVVPIAQYGCEVWGSNYIPQNSKNNIFFDQAILSKHITETLQYRYMKLLLSVPRQTSNWAVSTETGRFPIIIKKFKAMIKYIFHLTNSKSPFLKAALSTSRVMAQAGANTWFKAASRILTYCNLEHLLYTCDTNEIDYQLRNLDKKLKNVQMFKNGSRKEVSLWIVS